MSDQPTEQQAGGSSELWVAPSWEQIVTDHSARVYRLAYRLTGNLHDAEDLTQEVFVRVFRSPRPLHPRHLRGLAAPDHHEPLPRPGPAQGRIRFDALADDADHRLPSALPAPDTAYLNQMFDADVEAALADLPPDFRAAVVLCDVEGLTYEEIADVLDLKLGTVRSRIHRGRAMLRKALAHRAPKAGRVRYSGPAAVAEQPDMILWPGRPPRRPCERARRRPALAPEEERAWAHVMGCPGCRGWSSARAGSRPGSPRCPTPRPRRGPACSAPCTTWTPGPPSTRSSVAVAPAVRRSPPWARDRCGAAVLRSGRLHRTAGRSGGAPTNPTGPGLGHLPSSPEWVHHWVRRPGPCGVTQNRTRE